MNIIRGRFGGASMLLAAAMASSASAYLVSPLGPIRQDAIVAGMHVQNPASVITYSYVIDTNTLLMLAPEFDDDGTPILVHYEDGIPGDATILFSQLNALFASQLGVPAAEAQAVWQGIVDDVAQAYSQESVMDLQFVAANAFPANWDDEGGAVDIDDTPFTAGDGMNPPMGTLDVGFLFAENGALGCADRIARDPLDPLRDGVPFADLPQNGGENDSGVCRDPEQGPFVGDIRIAMDSSPLGGGATFAVVLPGVASIGGGPGAFEDGTIAAGYNSSGRDIILDPTQDWANPAGGFAFFRNTIAKAFGIALGLDEVPFCVGDPQRIMQIGPTSLFTGAGGGEDTDGDGVIDTTEDLNGNGVFDPGEDLDNDGNFDDFNEDLDGDGNFDVFYEDIFDLDGNFDNVNEDLDGDGNFDAADEDVNGNFLLDAGEDIDGDGRLDRGEDVNNNGVLDPGEDLDGDGVLDRSEDLDGDANFDTGEDLNANGVLDPGEDFDGDGMLDNTEDLDGDGNFDVGEDTMPTNNAADPGEDLNMDGFITLIEDLDVDGNFDIGEDRNLNGVLDPPAGGFPIVTGAFPRLVFGSADPAVNLLDNFGNTVLPIDEARGIRELYGDPSDPNNLSVPPLGPPFPSFTASSEFVVDSVTTRNSSEDLTVVGVVSFDADAGAGALAIPTNELDDVFEIQFAAQDSIDIFVTITLEPLPDPNDFDSVDPYSNTTCGAPIDYTSGTDLAFNLLDEANTVPATIQALSVNGGATIPTPIGAPQLVGGNPAGQDEVVSFVLTQAETIFVSVVQDPGMSGETAPTEAQLYRLTIEVDNTNLEEGVSVQAVFDQAERLIAINAGANEDPTPRFSRDTAALERPVARFYDTGPNLFFDDVVVAHGESFAPLSTFPPAGSTHARQRVLNALRPDGLNGYTGAGVRMGIIGTTHPVATHEAFGGRTIERIAYGTDVAAATSINSNTGAPVFFGDQNPPLPGFETVTSRVAYSESAIPTAALAMATGIDVLGVDDGNPATNPGRNFTGVAPGMELVSASVPRDLLGDLAGRRFRISEEAALFNLLAMAAPQFLNPGGSPVPGAESLPAPVDVILNVWGDLGDLRGDGRLTLWHDWITDEFRVPIFASAGGNTGFPGDNGEPENDIDAIQGIVLGGFLETICPGGGGPETGIGSPTLGFRTIVAPATGFNVISVGSVGLGTNSNSAYPYPAFPETDPEAEVIAAPLDVDPDDLALDTIPQFSARGHLDTFLFGTGGTAFNARPGIDIVALGAGVMVREFATDIPPRPENFDPCDIIPTGNTSRFLGDEPAGWGNVTEFDLNIPWVDSTFDANGDGVDSTGEDLPPIDGFFDTGEDLNANGVLDPGEDIDGDGFLDTTEDLDGDGNFDVGEDTVITNGVLDPGEDLDGDSFLDTTEDLNGNGVLDAGEDLDGDGFFDAINEDLDGDSNPDFVNEDANGDGLFDQGETILVPDLLNVAENYREWGGTELSAGVTAGSYSLLKEAANLYIDLGIIENPEPEFDSLNPLVLRAVMYNGAKRTHHWSNISLTPGFAQDRFGGQMDLRFNEDGTYTGIPTLCDTTVTAVPFDSFQGAGVLDMGAALENLVLGYNLPVPASVDTDGDGTNDIIRSYPTFPFTNPSPFDENLPANQLDPARGITRDATETDPAVPTVTQILVPASSGLTPAPVPGDPAGDADEGDIVSAGTPGRIGAIDSTSQVPFRDLGSDNIQDLPIDDPILTNEGGPDVPALPISLIDPIMIEAMGWDLGNIGTANNPDPDDPGEPETFSSIVYVLADPPNPGDILEVSLVWNRTVRFGLSDVEGDLSNPDFSDPTDVDFGDLTYLELEDLSVRVFEIDPSQELDASQFVDDNVIASSDGGQGTVEYLVFEFGAASSGTFAIEVNYNGPIYDFFGNLPDGEVVYGLAWRLYPSPLVDAILPDAAPVLAAGDQAPDPVATLINVIVAYGTKIGQARFDVEADLDRNGAVDDTDFLWAIFRF
ncbi:MAG: hypothetical protein AAGI30_08395 [Planctomycetota bacterium]